MLPAKMADAGLRERLVLGQLPGAEVERLTAKYANDDRLSALAEVVALNKDTLLGSLFHHETPADSEVSDRLARRLVDRIRSSRELSVATESGGSGMSEVPEPIPDRLEYFRIEGLLGRGGMGNVYLAHDTRLDRKVAIKTMRLELGQKPGAKDRFLREARSAAKLENDHIVPIFYIGETDGTPFLAMPYLHGETLAVRLRRGELTVAEAVRIAREVALGLVAAHAQGLIHRDIKPANVWLESSSGRARILDFGLARSQQDDTHLTASGVLLGTPAYMAPEQARSQPVDFRSDLFSLGCVLYQMLTGSPPFTGPDTMSILTSLAVDTPRLPCKVNASCPEALSTLTMRLLSRDPAQRPQTAREVAEALAKVDVKEVDHTAILTPPPPTKAHPEETADHKAPAPAPVVLPLPSRRWRGAVAAMILMALLPAGLVGAWLSGMVFTVETPKGALVVEIDGQEVKARVKGGELHVLDDKGNQKYTLKASDAQKITVVGADGLTLDTDKFEIIKNDVRKIRVTLRPAEVTRDTDRRAAEWVLSVGGKVRVDGQAKDISAVADLPRAAFRLATVDLTENRKVGDEELAVLAGRSGLTRLMLGGTKVTDKGLLHFVGCKGLIHLSLHGTAVTDAGLALIPHNPELVYLDLNNTRVTDKGLAHFAGCTKLDSLFLTNTAVSDAGLSHFRRCTALRWLYLGGTKVTDNRLAHFADCKQLFHLQLERTATTDASLPVLRGFTSLGYLDLRNTKVTASKVAELLPECRIVNDGETIEPRSTDRKAAEWVLALGGTVSVNDQPKVIAADTDLPGWPLRLTEVQLRGNAKVTDRDVEKLARCKHLRNLSLAFTPVTDTGLAHLAGCKGLTRLLLDNTAVSDKSLPVLRGFPALTELSVKGAKVKLTPSTAFALAMALPECRITHDSGVIPTWAADRRAVEWVLSVGGKARVNNDAKAAAAVGELPKGPYRLKAIELDKNKKVTDEGLANLAGCKHLIHLSLDATPVTDQGLKHLAGFRYLTSLRLGETKVSDEGLANFAGIDTLHGLVLSGTQVTDKGLANFRGCKRLGYLFLATTQVGDSGLAHFAGCTTLTQLDLSGTATTDVGLANFAGCKSLYRLILNNTKVGDKGLAHFKGRTGLMFLGLTLTQVSNEGLASFAGCKGLIGLSLGGAKVGDKGLVHFAGCKSLTHLNLNGTGVSDAGLAHFKDCKNIQSLNLITAQVSDAGLAHFSGCRTLTAVTLGGKKITNSGFALFAGCKGLAKVYLRNTSVNDAGVASLIESKGLIDLDVSQTGVTAAQVGALAKAQPQCRIVFDGGVVEPFAPDRTGALWVLKMRGTVFVNGDRTRGITAAADLPAEPFRLTGVQFEDNKGLTDEGLAILADCTRLTDLRLEGVSVGDVGLAHLGRCKSLTILLLVSTKATDAGLANFAACKDLQTLSLHGTKVGDAGLAHFAKCKNLSYLNLAFTKVTDKGLAHFAGSNRIGQLHLFNTAVTDTGLAHFKDNRDLFQLDVSSTVVSDASVLLLRSFDVLGSLNVVGTKVTPARVAELARALPECTINHKGGVITARPSPDRKAAEWALSIGGKVQVSDHRGTGTRTALPKEPFRLMGVDLRDNAKVTDASLMHFEGCKNLTRLDLGNTATGDRGLSAFAASKGLTHLYLTGTQVGDVGVTNFADCKDLTRLDLSGTRVTDKGLACFAGSPRLEFLRLGGTKVTSAGLAHLAGCRKLNTLGLTNTPVGDDGLVHLADLGQLARLNLAGTKVSKAGLDRLAKALPRCAILRDGIEP